ncbi:unnamed protein product, partial [marine sediment metagenome]
MTYNGWRNHETWCVYLHITNEEGSYNYWMEAAQNAWKEAPHDAGTGDPWTVSETARFRLADRLKYDHEEMVGSVFEEASRNLLWLDLLQSALSDVEWAEI